MKRFHEFLKENKLDKINTKELTYQEFLQSVTDSCINDFNMTEEQSLELTILYRDMFKNAYEKGLTTREAIASTKRPGVVVGDDTIEESYIFNIDTIYESYLDKIESETKPENIEAYVADYFHRFNETYSDKRIFERVKNNYKRLIQLADKKIFEMDYTTKDGASIDVDVIERDDKLIDDVIDAFSFVYKKKKDRYLRPIKITGKTTNKDIELEIVLSNKDIVKITHDDTEDMDDLKISINGKVIYHMDGIDIKDMVDKVSILYDLHLKDQNFKINKKVNPFA